MANLKARFYPESEVAGFTDVDGTMAFYTRVNALLTPSSVLLDIGAGRGKAAEDPFEIRRNLRKFKGRVKRVIGIDLDPAISENPLLDEYHIIKPDQGWPVADRSVDVAVSDAVLEHIDDVELFFSECGRTIKLGGWLCIRTANRWNYVALASSLFPNALHARLLKRIQPDREGPDVFPTLYKCNTPRRVRRQLRSHGFEATVYGYEAEPSYLGFSSVAYALGVLHQRFAPSSLRAAIFAFGRRR